MLSSPNLIIEGSHPYGDDEVWDLAMWLCNNILPDEGYEIVVTFRKFTKKHDGDQQGNHISMDRYNHEIEISNSLKLSEALIALVHEFVHVIQYMIGYITVKGKKSFCMGKEVPDNTYYFDRPWEQHARLMEQIYYNQYLRTNSLNLSKS